MQMREGGEGELAGPDYQRTCLFLKGPNICCKQQPWQQNPVKLSAVPLLLFPPALPPAIPLSPAPVVWRTRCQADRALVIWGRWCLSGTFPQARSPLAWCYLDHSGRAGTKVPSHAGQSHGGRRFRWQKTWATCALVYPGRLVIKNLQVRNELFLWQCVWPWKPLPRGRDWGRSFHPILQML